MQYRDLPADLRAVILDIVQPIISAGPPVQRDTSDDAPRDDSTIFRAYQYLQELAAGKSVEYQDSLLPFLDRIVELHAYWYGGPKPRGPIGGY